MLDDSIGISWESVYKISHSWVDVLIFLVLLFWVFFLPGLMRFRDGSDSKCASHFVQILEKVRQRPWQWWDKHSGKGAWAVHGKYKLTETQKKVRQAKSKVSSMLISFLDIKGDCSHWIHPGRPNSQVCMLLWRFTETAWKYAKISPWTLVTTELAVASWQRTVSLFLFHQWIFDQKQHVFAHTFYILSFPDWR
jgi:hypothetical protein